VASLAKTFSEENKKKYFHPQRRSVLERTERENQELEQTTNWLETNKK